MTALETLELELNETVARLWSAIQLLKNVPSESRDEDYWKRWNNYDGQMTAIQAVRSRMSTMMEAAEQDEQDAAEFNEKAGQAPVGWEIVEGSEPIANGDFVLVEGEESPLFTSA